MVTTSAAERFLSAPLLSEADPASRRAVLNVLSEERLEAGAALLEQGRPNDRLAFLIDGSVTIERLYPGGRVDAVATLVAPSIFGETSFFRHSPPIVTVRAVEPVWLLYLDHNSHDRLRRDHPKAAEELALAAVRVLAERFDLLDKRVSDFLAMHPNGPPRATEWSNFRERLFESAVL